MDIPSTRSRTARTRSTRNKAAEALKKLPTALLLKRKAECDARALKIVERMIEPDVAADWLLDSLSHINKTHMDDITEERSIVKLCGYPLCDKPLKKVVKKQYQISTLRNKVYDVSKVKNFCSYSCFTATEYLMEQMLTSPLWHREQEDIPTFKILPKSQSRSKSPPGVEVDLTGVKLPDDNDEGQTPVNETVESVKREINTTDSISLAKTEQKAEKSRSKESQSEAMIGKRIPEVEVQTVVGSKERINFTETQNKYCSMIPVEEKKNSTETQNKDQRIIAVEESRNSAETQNKGQSLIAVEEKGHSLKTQNKEGSIKPIGEQTNSPKPRNPNRSTISTEEKPSETKVQDKERSTETHSSQSAIKSSTEARKTERRKLRESKKAISFDTLTTRVENSFQEWITEETIRLLHGEDAEKQKILENVRTQEKYAVLCKKLNHLQVEEEREANDRIGELKPAPEFSALQEEAKGLELKVRAFYEGRTVIDRNAATSADTAKPEDNQTEVVLPMIDMHAPKALRRRIFLDKLNKVLPDLLRALGGSGQTSSSHYSYTSERCAAVRALVTTFSLSSTNITFKTPEWTLVALIIIKLLAFVDPRMKYLLASKQASLYTSMILLSYKLDPNYLDRLVVSLMTPAKSIEENESPNS